jgi:hypothetical protein
VRFAGQLNIGPLQFDLQAAAPLTVCYPERAYAGFFHAKPTASNALRRLPVTVTRGAEPIPTTEPLFRGGRNWAVWDAGDEWQFAAGFHERSVARWMCRLARDFSRASVTVDFTGDVCVAPLCYPLDQILSWGLLAGIGGVLLHASVAVRNGVALVFAGRSGAGKSTLASLVHAQGWRILNDDRVLVFKRGGEWRVAGTPWHGSGRFAEAHEAPLAGLFFLQQALAERIEEMAPSEIRLALLDVASVPWFADDWAQPTLDTLERLCAEAPVRRFHFTASDAAAIAVAEAADRLRMEEAYA